MEIRSETVQSRIPVTIIRPSGHFDVVGADDFDAYVTKVVNDGDSDMLVDLGDVTFLSSSGIGSINNLFYQLHTYDQEEFKKDISPGIRNGTYKAPHLKLLNSNDRIENTLRLMGIDRYIDIFFDEDEAVQAF